MGTASAKPILMPTIVGWILATLVVAWGLAKPTGRVESSTDAGERTAADITATTGSTSLKVSRLDLADQP